MKSGKGLHHKDRLSDGDNSMKKSVKLEPVKKNGKEKRAFINDIDEDEDDLLLHSKRESVLDYLDDGDEDEDYDEEDEDEEYDDEE